MTNQAGRAIEAPIPKGSRTPRPGVANGSIKKNLPRSPQSPTNFLSGCSSEGTHISEKGPTFPDMGSRISETYSDLEIIRAAELSPTGTLIAQFMWATANFIRTQGGSDRRIEDLSVPEIVDFVRRSEKGGRQ